MLGAVRTFVIAIVATSCVQPNLVPCGDLSCPAGSTCVADRCADAEQIAACDGLPDGTACSVFIGDGRCLDGACAIIRCGNGILDPGEVCDDNNRADHDGCRSDCLSTEVCGNGLVDPGETCDCGSDDATRPPGCAMANSTDVRAQCDPACGRYCGDGAVTGAEACDGAAVPLACRDFGYYYGAVTCTPFCSLDRDACNGRCGDGVTQADQNEQCDGAIPPGMSCVGLGFDFGAIGCSPFCTVEAATTCHRFGWEVVFDGLSTGGFLQSAAVNAHGAMARNFDLLGVKWDGVRIERTLTTTTIVATDDAFVALGTTAATKYDASGWTDLAAPGAFVNAVADGGSVYLLDAGCTLRRFDVATWTPPTLPASGLTICAGLDVQAGKILVGGGDRIAKYDGAWTVRTGLFNIQQVAWHDATHVVARANGLPTYIDLTPLIPTVPMSASGITNVVSNFQGDALDHNGFTSVDVLQGLIRYAVAPPSGISSLFEIGRATDGGFIGYSRSIYRLRPDYTTILPGLFTFAFDGQPDGSVTSCDESTVYQFGVGTTVQRPFASTNGICVGLAGPVVGQHFVMTDSPNNLFRFDTGTSSYVLEHSFPGGPLQLRLDGTGSPWALTSNDILRRLPNGTWTSTAPPTCTWKDLDTSATEVYALGSCGGMSVVHRWTGTGWQALAATAVSLTKLSVAKSDGTVFAAGARLARLDGTMWTLLDPPTQWAIVTARAADDVYVVDANGFLLAHWDGMRSSPIVTGGRVFDMEIGPRGLLLNDAVGLRLLPRWPPVVPGL